MPKETTSVKNQRFNIARDIIKDILFTADFKVTKKIKFGPRYYVAEGILNHRKTVFKICLFSDSVDHLTNEKFSREILFLNFIKQSSSNYLKATVPHLHAFGLKPRAWYIREYLYGQAENIAGGNVKFKNRFFNQRNLGSIIKLFTSLQSIKRPDLPGNFQKLLYPPDFTKHLWRFIRPHWQRIEHYMKWPGLASLIKKEFKRYAPIYNHAPHVLAHQEPYAPHFLKIKNGFHLIDWENVGWSNPTHDIVVLWMRAYQHPEWQKQLYQRFKRYWHHYKKFDDLWTIEVLIQSVFNVIGWHFYNDKQDFKGLVKFSDKKIREILANNFKIYN